MLTISKYVKEKSAFIKSKGFALCFTNILKHYHIFYKKVK